MPIDASNPEQDRDAPSRPMSGTDRQQAFLLQLGDAHAALDDPAAIMQTSARLLCEHLSADRTLYLGIEDTDGKRQFHVRGQYSADYPPLPDRFDDSGSLGWVTAQLRTGQPVVVANAATDPRLDPEVRRAWLATGVRAVVAVPLLRHGREVVHFGCHHYSVREWTEAEVAVIAEVAERTRAAVDRARAETALRASEAKYRAIVDSIDEGIALIEAVRGDTDTGLVFREVNPAFARQFGLGNVPGAAAGRSVAELLPALVPGSLDAFRHIRRDGTPIRPGPPLRLHGRWFEVRYTPVGARDSGLITVVCSDVTERRQTEQELHQRQQRHEFLLRLADALRPVSDPQAMQDLAMQVLARHLGVNRAEYYEIDASGEYAILQRDNEGEPPRKLRFRFADYGPGPQSAYMAGRTYVCPDTAALPKDDPGRINFPAAGVGAVVGVPIIKDGLFRAVMTVMDSGPRDWSSLDLALVAETAERVWASVQHARAQAAQQASEARYRTLFDGMDEGVVICSALRDPAGRVVDARFDELNPAYELQTGLNLALALGSTASSVFPRYHRSLMAIADRVLRSGCPAQVEHFVSDLGRWFSIRVAPFGDRNGFSAFYSDITEARCAAEKLRDSEERLRSFGEASSDVLWIRNAETLALEYLSPAAAHVLGVPRDWNAPENALEAWSELVIPRDRAVVRQAMDRVRQGEHLTYDLRIRHRGDRGIRMIRSTEFPIRDPMGRVTRIGGVCHDGTDEQETAERLKLLVGELQHRTRNLLGVVRSVADRTLAGSASLDEFSERFRDRLAALARANRLLSRLSEGDRITFDELLRVELAAHGVANGSDYGGRLRLSGPPGISLRSSMVQPLALGLHELATNALKYGAMAMPEGRLAIQWWLEETAPRAGGQEHDGPKQAGLHEPAPELLLRVDWRETGVVIELPDRGPGPRPPSGSGRELIERALPYQLKAETTYELTPTGVHCTIVLPLSGSDAGGPIGSRIRPTT